MLLEKLILQRALHELHALRYDTVDGGVLRGVLT